MADFSEVTEQLRALLESLQGDPSQIIDPRSVDWAKSIAVAMSDRTKSQKEYGKALGEDFLISKSLVLYDRQRVIEAKVRNGLSGKSLENAEAELAVITETLSRNEQTMGLIQRQVQEFGDQMSGTVRLSETQERIRDIKFEMVELDARMGSATLEQLKAIQDQKDELGGTLKFLKNADAHAQEAAAQQTLRQAQEETFGISVEKINEKIAESGRLMSTRAGRAVIIYKALKSVIAPIVVQLQELRNTGLSWSQTMDAGLDTLKSIKSIGGIRGVLTMKDTIEATQALRENFADISFQTPKIAAVASEMMTAFKLSANESAELVETLAKVSGFSGEAQEHILHVAQAFGNLNKMKPAALLKAVADNAGVFARFGEQGTQAFMRSVTAAKRLGIEMSSMESAADSFLDIDTFFQDVSKLRTLGIDLADPFGLAQIAETGTPEELIEELQRQLQGVDLTKLSRTRRNALASTLNMSQEELGRLISGEAGVIETATDEQVKNLGGFNKGMGGAIDALGAFTKMFSGLSSILQLTINLMAAQAIMGGGRGGARGLIGAARGLAGGAGRGGRFAVGLLGRGAGAVAGGAASAAGGISSAVGGLATAAAPVLAVGGTIVGGLAAGLAAGTAALEFSNKFFGTEFSTLADFKRISKGEEDARLATIESRAARAKRGLGPGEGPSTPTATEAATVAKAATVAVATTEEAEPIDVATKEQMAELLEFFRKGFVVNIDGRKAGKLMAVAQGPAF